ncbi:putative ribonuclease H protein [Sesbania bispinosa]|nr:putative ribonuclease H protein [Sesbania bispinosa]
MTDITEVHTHRRFKSTGCRFLLDRSTVEHKRSRRDPPSTTLSSAAWFFTDDWIGRLHRTPSSIAREGRRQELEMTILLAVSSKEKKEFWKGNSWVEANLCNSSMGFSKYYWALIFGVVLDQLWMERNKIMFDKIDSSAGSVWHRTSHIIDEIQNAYGIDKSIHLRRSMDRDVYIKWIPPPPDLFKINLDGAVLISDKLVGCDGVLRDLFSNSHGAFSSFLDSNTAIRFIKFGCNPTHFCFSLVEDIRKLAEFIPDAIWSHTRREGNFLADAFANHAIRCQELYVEFSSVPPSLL